MAELHVQRKRNNYWWLWILLILIIAAAIWLYMNYNHKNGNLGNILNIVTTDSTHKERQNESPADTTSGTAGFWHELDFNMPDTNYSEVNDKNVKEKANEHYAIYSIKNDVLFGSNKTDLQPAGKNSLQQIAASINKRFKDADVRIYSRGYTSGNEKQYNAQLAEQRAEAVKNFLARDSKLNEKHISVNPVGDSAVSSKATTAEGQKTSSINIVARR
jgi:outer membrane protein OmpA-like peptidoglycan-associated protein